LNLLLDEKEKGALKLEMKVGATDNETTQREIQIMQDALNQKIENLSQELCSQLASSINFKNQLQTYLQISNEENEKFRERINNLDRLSKSKIFDGGSDMIKQAFLSTFEPPDQIDWLADMEAVVNESASGEQLDYLEKLLKKSEQCMETVSIKFIHVKHSSLFI
jgi:cystathionine beta-lyase/cystathionine gamma-synthase